MSWPDYVVLLAYFAVMIGIGIYTSRKIHKQEDYFLGGRSFGKLLQTFAAFGAGTGSSDPVQTGRTTFTSGMSGMWSVMSWLFVTPFYWITGIWYRRMRHLTLGDWFVERYESRNMGLAYTVFGLLFFMVYGSMFFSAIGKVAAPLVGFDAVVINQQEIPIEYVLVPVIGIVVLIYGIAGGLEAAYYTDLVQGICIILLSLLLIPFGLHALVERFGDPSQDGLLDGFRIMHQQLPEEFFSIVGTGGASEFPLQRIVAVVIISLVGIVVQPHFIATGGGSAKNENSARIGLVTGNFLKRFCTIGWVLTGLIALALYANNEVLIADPDKVWGVASRDLLPAGFTGLMLACLLAALMSSVDAYMVVGSALVVRNVYAAYFNAHATEKTYIRFARITGSIVVIGSVAISLSIMNVFEQLQLTWVFAVLFAAPFWIGMYWRGATTAAAWVTVAYCTAMFFVVPFAAPRLFPELRFHENYLATNLMVQVIETRPASPSDVSRRQTEIQTWQQAAATAEAITDPQQRMQRLEELGPPPQPLEIAQSFATSSVRGGQSVFWGDGVKPVDAEGRVLSNFPPQPVGEPVQIDDNLVHQRLAYDDSVRLKGFGNFKLDFLLYQWMGMDFSSKTDATLATLELPAKIVSPFLVMILISLVTPRNSQRTLDRYYAKMKTPVDPDPQRDREQLEAVYASPDKTVRKKLFPGTSLEFQRPNWVDIVGVAVCFAICFAIIGLAMFVARIGA